jgi:D-lactate dehydrogenase
VVQREITSLRNSGKQPHLAASLSKAFLYEGDRTCATDGLCALACPVNIDCGKLVKRIRKDHSKNQDKVAMTIANNMAFVTSAGRKVLSAVSFFHFLLGDTIMKGISGGLRTISFGKIPAWNPHMPSGSRRIRKENNEGKYSRKVVYFPSCINRTMGLSADYKEEKQLTEKMTGLLHKSGYEIIFPENMNQLCCGMAFSSKGFVEAGQKKSGELMESLLKASENGKYPVVCDMSPCLYTMKENMKDALKLSEPVEFILEHVIPYLNISPVNEHITVFPVCSMKKMGLEGKLLQLARLCAKKVTVAETNCCGFAGDRGFTFPELNKHGLRNLKEQLPAEVKNGYCNSRTCEIGLSAHSGITYKSIVYLVDEASDYTSSTPG